MAYHVVAKTCTTVKATTRYGASILSVSCLSASRRVILDLLSTTFSSVSGILFTSPIEIIVFMATGMVRCPFRLQSHDGDKPVN